jgi:hypothetical protein
MAHAAMTTSATDRRVEADCKRTYIRIPSPHTILDTRIRELKPVEVLFRWRLPK